MLTAGSKIHGDGCRRSRCRSPDVAPPAADSLVSDAPVVLQEEASVAPVEEQEIEPVAPVAPEIPVLVQEVPQRPVVSRPAGRPLWLAREKRSRRLSAPECPRRDRWWSWDWPRWTCLVPDRRNRCGVALTWLVSRSSRVPPIET